MRPINIAAPAIAPMAIPAIAPLDRPPPPPDAAAGPEVAEGVAEEVDDPVADGTPPVEKVIKPVMVGNITPAHLCSAPEL